MLKYSSATHRFALVSPAGEARVLRGPFEAAVHRHSASPSALDALAGIAESLKKSSATESSYHVPVPAGCELHPFQIAGVEYASERQHALFGDEPGLGKTVQAIGLANSLMLCRLLVVCPAGLRINWQREIDKWHTCNPGVSIVLDGRGFIHRERSIVISYDLVKTFLADLKRIPFDLIIFDEAHYLKNPAAIRTKACLRHLVSVARRAVALTGTPIPNRVTEIYPLLKALCPEAVGGMSYPAFVARYAMVVDGNWGPRVVGVKNAEELAIRLRSHFMVRREKRDVLSQLPEKQYKMVVFSPDHDLRLVLEREKQFSANEIIRHGAPVGSALPEIRREMGLAKVPAVLQYLRDMLEGGTQKVVVFAHHRDVLERLHRGLPGSVLVYGSTGQDARQRAVDAFQSEEGPAVFLGQIQAAGTGITLTAASDVVFAESSWVPGEDEQASDRCHRIGQKNAVTIHYLVVEESLDAAVLAASSAKRKDINAVMRGE